MPSSLAALLYEDLRLMASRFLSREGSHTLQATDLANECFLKLAGRGSVGWQGKTHFMAASARVMRFVLVDHARAKRRAKRGGSGRVRLELRDDHAFSRDFPDQAVFVGEVLARLADLDPLHARILEFRLFDGLDFHEIAERLGLCTRTVERHWSMVRAWFLKEMDGSP